MNSYQIYSKLTAQFLIKYSFDTATNGGTGGLGGDEAGLIGGDSGYPALINLGAVVARFFQLVVVGLCGLRASRQVSSLSFVTYLL